MTSWPLGHRGSRLQAGAKGSGQLSLRQVGGTAHQRVTLGDGSPGPVSKRGQADAAARAPGFLDSVAGSRQALSLCGGPAGSSPEMPRGRAEIPALGRRADSWEDRQ